MCPQQELKSTPPFLLTQTLRRAHIEIYRDLNTCHRGAGVSAQSLNGSHHKADSLEDFCIPGLVVVLLLRFALLPLLTGFALASFALCERLQLALIHPSLLRKGQAQIKAHAIIELAADPELAAHSKARRRERNATLWLILVPDGRNLAFLLTLQKLLEWVVALLPRKFLLECLRLLAPPRFCLC